MALRVSWLLLTVVIALPAHAFQLATLSAPRAHDGVGGALWASVVGGAGGVSAVLDVDKRLAECQKELLAADEKISNAEALLETTPDSETKRLLAEAMAVKRELLVKENSLVAEKKQLKKEKQDEQKLAERAETKTFWVQGPFDGKWRKETLQRGDWAGFFSTIRAGLKDAANADAPAVYRWDGVVEGTYYTTERAPDVDSLKSQLDQQQKTLANRVDADEEAMGRMLEELLRPCFPDIANVPPARTIYGWKTDDAAKCWSSLIESWMKAETPEDKVAIEVRMDDLKTREATKSLREFDAEVEAELRRGKGICRGHGRYEG